VFLDTVFNIKPPSDYFPSQVALAVFNDRKSHIERKERQIYEANMPDFFSSIDKGLKDMSNEEQKHWTTRNFKDLAVALPFIFIMNLVVGATRTFLCWDLKKKKVPIGISDDEFDTQIREECRMLRKFLKDFSKLVISTPHSCFFFCFLHFCFMLFLL
jgi:hypothetical protein